MRSWKLIGTTLMATVAISTQPVQYGLFAGAGRALAKPRPLWARRRPPGRPE